VQVPVQAKWSARQAAALRIEGGPTAYCSGYVRLARQSGICGSQALAVRVFGLIWQKAKKVLAVQI
jgi:hypothetical protein